MTRAELEAMAEKTSKGLIEALNIVENKNFLEGVFEGLIIQAFKAGRNAAADLAVHLEARMSEEEEFGCVKTAHDIRIKIKALGEDPPCL